MDTKEFFKKAREGLETLLKDRPSHEFGKPLKNVKPIFEKKEGDTACLMLHGWTSTPFEFRQLADYLSKKDITVSVPLLPGHGTSFEALKKISYQDWVLRAEKELEKIQKEYKKTFLIGNSLGGNISFVLANRYPDIKGIISIGTPIYFRNHQVYKAFLEIASFFKEEINKRYPKRVDKEIIRRKKHYKKLPLKSVKEVFKIMRLTREVLKSVEVPVFIIQSEIDQVVTNENAFKIYSKLSSKKKVLKFVPDAYHVITDDHRHFDLFGDIYEFIKNNNK